MVSVESDRLAVHKGVAPTLASAASASPSLGLAGTFQVPLVLKMPVGHHPTEQPKKSH